MRLKPSRSFFAKAALTSMMLALAASPALAQGKPGDKPAAGAPAKTKPKSDKEKKDEAKKLFEQAQAKFAAGEYAAAYELYKQADELVPGAVPKFKMAESLDKAGDVDGAIKAYQAFLASNPPKDKHQERIDASNTRIKDLENAPADVKIAITPADAAGVVFAIDGKDAGTANPVKVPPGKHTVTAKAEGFEEAKIEVEVKRGEKKEVPLTLTPKAKAGGGAVEVPKEPEKPQPPKEPPSTESEGGSTLIPAIVTLSLAGAGAVVGGVFGVLALQSKSDYEETPTQELFDETERNALIADMSFGVALTFGVTGLVLLLTDSGGGGEEKPEEKPAEKKAGVVVTPFAGPQGGGIFGTVTF